MPKKPEYFTEEMGNNVFIFQPSVHKEVGRDTYNPKKYTFKGTRKTHKSRLS